MKLSVARQKALAKARAAQFAAPKATVLQEMEQEGRDDFKHLGDAAMNPYMGSEGDAWARGFWAAKAGE